jgi:PAS domain S-box-containing protein
MSETLPIKKEGFGILTKLMSGFILVLVLNGMGNFYSFNQMNRLYDLTTNIFNHPLQVTRAVLSADTNIVKIHRSMKDVALSSTAIEIETAIGFVNDYEKNVHEHLGVVKKWILGEEGMMLHAETAQLFREWKPIRDEVITLTQAGNRTQAFAITKGKGAKHVELLNKKIEELKNYAAVKASVMLRDSLQTKEKIINTTLIIFVVLVISAAFFGFFLSRTITNSLKQVIKGVTEFGRGNLDFKIETNLKDEIGWLAKAFNNMATQRKKVEMELLNHREHLEDLVKGRTAELEEEITERKQVEEKLRNSEDQFRLVTQTAEIGITNADLITGQVIWDETCYKIHGYKPETPIKLDYFLDKIIHPKEKTRVLPNYRSALDMNDNRHRVEYRIIRPDGSVRWLDEDHAIVRDENGKAIRTYSAKIDITERKHAEEKIKPP